MAVSMGESRRVRGGWRADARMRRCLILRQGDKPPETPGPLSLGLDCTEGRTAVKGALRRQHRPPLTAVLPSEETPSSYEGKGAQRLGLIAGCKQNNRPPNYVIFYLTEAGLLMEATTVRAWSRTKWGRSSRPAGRSNTQILNDCHRTRAVSKRPLNPPSCRRLLRYHDLLQETRRLRQSLFRRK